MASDDAARFEAVYRQHFRAVLGYTLARLGPEQAKDAAAQTFLVAWRKLDEVPSEPAGWLFGVARKVVADQLRADSRRAALAGRLAGPEWRGAVRQASDPAEQVADRDAALVALARLAPGDREILTLLAWHGLTASQAATALGLGSRTFAVRLHRARRRLDRALAVADTELPPAAAAPAPAPPASAAPAAPARCADETPPFLEKHQCEHEPSLTGSPAPGPSS